MGEEVLCSFCAVQYCDRFFVECGVRGVVSIEF